MQPDTELANELPQLPYRFRILSVETDTKTITGNSGNSDPSQVLLWLIIQICFEAESQSVTGRHGTVTSGKLLVRFLVYGQKHSIWAEVTNVTGNELPVVFAQPTDEIERMAFVRTPLVATLTARSLLGGL